MSRTHPRVGDFLLEAPLGRGGMGEVWRGRHLGTKTPVAVKLLRASVAEDPYYLSRFRAEVRAVAALDHPNVVRVYDHGTLDADQPRLGGGIQAGSPWLAMELLDGEPLSRRGRVSEWADAEKLLRALLDALGHAHARGLVHRDLKPGNVVVAGERVVLLDFGLAHAVNDSLDPDELGTIIGTAAYMAPEQFRGRDTDFGPWTDLYALGCLGWALLCGRPPYGVGQSAQALGKAHLQGSLPRLEAPMAVPRGVEEWLHRLLQKDPRQRFRRAADASWALGQLRFEAQHTLNPDAPATLSLAAVSDHETVITDHSPEGESAEARGSTPYVLRPPLPAGWRRGEHAHPLGGGLPVGTGLGLFGLRELPLVGREAARDQLWAALHQLDQGQGPVVLLQGPAGCGKSRLARWLSTRAHELGAVEIFEVRHSLEGGRSDGIGAALARHLRVAGLPRDLAEATLRRRLAAEGEDEDSLADLLEVALPSPPRGLQRLLGRRAGLSSAAERYSIVARRIWKEARWRPVLLHLDDVQWGADSLAFCLHLMANQPAGMAPVMVLLTARELDPEGPEAQLLDRLMLQPAARRVPVQPLEPGYRPTFLRQLIALEPELAERVEARSQGIPLFMVQLLEGWIHQAALLAGPEGFVLREGADDALPDDLHALWRERLGRALRRRSPLERHALEVAAVLGLEVSMGEWREAAQEAGVWASPQVVEDLLQAGLAEPHADGPHQGFRFVHALLRDSLLREAEETGRLSTWRRAAASMLRQRRREDPGVCLRLGHLLQALGEQDAAVEALSVGAWEAVRRSEYLMAERALRDREVALLDLGLPPGDRRPCEGWIMQARVARRRDQRALAVQFTRRAEAVARREGWEDLLCQALREQARLHWSRGRLRRASLALKEAADLAQRGEDSLTLAWCLRDFGLVAVELGAAPVAVLEQAAAAFVAHEEHFGRATCLLALGTCQLQAGEDGAAQRALDAASAEFRASLRLQEPAQSWVGLGDVARLQGRLPEAQACYLRALTRFRTIGARGSDAARLGLVGVRLELGRCEEALPVLQGLLSEALESEARGLLGPIYLHLALHAALLGHGPGVLRFLALAKEEVLGAGEVRSLVVQTGALILEACERSGLSVAAGTAEVLLGGWREAASA